MGLFDDDRRELELDLGGPANFRGLYEVIFMNGDVFHVDVEANIVNSDAHPLYLKSTDGRFYPWMAIQSIKKAE